MRTLTHSEAYGGYLGSIIHGTTLKESPDMKIKLITALTTAALFALPVADAFAHRL